MPNVNVNDISLYYEESGEGEPLLFLHGLGTDGRSWEYQRDFFAEQFRVIVVDVRGHGRSAQPPGPYSVSQFAADIFALLDHLQIDQFHLVGLSMGGMIGFQMAVDQPKRCKSLTIVNSGPELVPRTLKERWQILQRRLVLNFSSMEKIGEFIGERLFPEPEQAEYKELFVKFGTVQKRHLQHRLKLLEATIGAKQLKQKTTQSDNKNDNTNNSSNETD